jgi:hypothetical protein
MPLRKNLFYFIITTAILIYVCNNLASQLIFSENQQHLYPLWDPATHAIYGWKMYYHLIHLQPLLFFWEIWSKGLWPFIYYLYQIPFYILTGSGFTGALISSLFGFFLIGFFSFIHFTDSLKTSSPITTSVFLFFLITSPFYLAFSSLAMTEIFGSMMQLLVYIGYLKVTELKTQKSAVLFSLLLTMLFFTKYNYFILVIIPIMINEYFTYTDKWKLRDHFDLLLKVVKKVFTSFTGLFLFVYSIFLIALFSTGGFEFNLFNQKVSVHSIGNTGYVVLYLLIIRFLIYKKRNKAGYFNFLNKDFRIKPLINYFIIPIIIWFVIPYPNHIKEFFGLIVNRQSEGFTIISGFAYYFNVLKNEYFANNLIFVLSMLIFLFAIIRYKNQNPTARFFIIVALIQIILIINHPYKDARFIFTTLLPIWIVIAYEINYWFRKLFRYEIIYYGASIIIISSALIIFKNLSDDKRYIKYAYNLYTERKDFTVGIDKIKNQISSKDKLAITGSLSNILSPALLEWQFGAPAGFGDYVGIISANDYGKLNSATYLLIIVPLETNTNVEMIESYNQQKGKISELISENQINLIVAEQIKNLKISFMLYKIILHSKNHL